MDKSKVRFRNHWNRKVWRKANNDWKSALSWIDNPYLKVKIASLIFFDGSQVKLIKGRDFSYLRELSSKYKSYYEDKYSIEDIENTLIELGYPKDIAIRRSQVPKIHKGKRVKNVT